MKLLKTTKWRYLRPALCLLVVAGLVLLISQPAVAATCGGVNTAILACEETDGADGIISVIKTVISVLSVMIGIVAVIGITIVGIQYLTAGGNVGQVEKAKRRLFELILGVVAYALMYAGLIWLLPGGVGFGIDKPQIKFENGISFRPVNNNNGSDDSDSGLDDLSDTTVAFDGNYDGSLGTAGSLAGRTVVVNFFVTEENCGTNSYWDAGTMSSASSRFQRSLGWLEGQMGGVSTFGLTYKDQSLTRHVKKTSGACIADNGFAKASIAINPIIEMLNYYAPLTKSECGSRADCTSIEELLDKYDADNVAFVLQLNSAARDNPLSGGYTQLYDPRVNGGDMTPLVNANAQIAHRKMTNYGYEFSVLFNKAGNDSYRTVTPVHELIHQFGAPDLYAGGWGSQGFIGSPSLVPPSYSSISFSGDINEILAGKFANAPEIEDHEIMGSAYAYGATIDQMRLTDITKYYAGVINESPNQTGFSQYGTWGSSQH